MRYRVERELVRGGWQELAATNDGEFAERMFLLFASAAAHQERVVPMRLIDLESDFMNPAHVEVLATTGTSRGD